MSQDKPSGFRHSYRTIYAGFLSTGRFPKTLQHQLVHDVREDVKGPFSSITVFAWMWTAINRFYQSYDNYLIACYPFHSNSYLSQPTGGVSTNGKVHFSLSPQKLRQSQRHLPVSDYLPVHNISISRQSASNTESGIRSLVHAEVHASY